MNARATTKKRTTARKKPAASAGTRTGRKKVGLESIEKAGTEILDRMKDIVNAQLGLYGEIYDEVNARVAKAKTDAPNEWKNLVRRGEKVEKDLKKAQGDLRKNLEKAQTNLKKDLERARKDLRAKVAKMRQS